MGLLDSLKKVVKDELGDSEGHDIIKKALKEMEINLDTADEEHKKNFIEVVLRNCPSFAMSKLKDLHNKMLQAVGIQLVAKTGGVDKAEEKEQSLTFNFDDPRFKDLNKILQQRFLVEEFWRFLEKFYLKIETYFQIYWTKSRELQSKGVDKSTVIQVSRRDFAAMRDELTDESKKLIERMQLSEQKHSRPHLYFFDNPHAEMVEKDSPEKIQTKSVVMNFLGNVEQNFQKVYRLFSDFLEEDLSVTQESQAEDALLKRTQSNMADLWKQLSVDYIHLRDELNLDKVHEKREEQNGGENHNQSPER